MGRRNKAYSKDLKQQMYQRLTAMLEVGQGTSKREAVVDGTDREKIFSERNNDEFVKFCKGTGCRRNILEKLEGRDLLSRQDMERELQAPSTDKKRRKILQEGLELFPDASYFLYHRKDKGGRDRVSPIIGANAGAIVARIKATAPTEKVWLNVPGNADVHGYRGDYATAIYKAHARPIEEIPYDAVNRGTGRRYQSGVYTCRKDEKGKKLDKVAMLKASKALGHNRLEVVANNYIRGL